MPFDTLPAVRPYMREGTAALAALVATRPARDVLSLVAAELAHRERPAARRLRDEVAAILSASVSSPVPADGEHGKARRVLDTPPAPDHLWPEPKPLVLDTVANAYGAEPVAFEVIPCAHGEVMPEYRETVIAGPVRSVEAAGDAPQPSGNGPSKPAKRAKLPAVTRDENQAARGAFNRLRWAAEAAAERETGRDAGGQALWASVPGAAHRIEVPLSVSQYIALNGKVQKGARSMILPAPRFWPNGSLPEGYADLGQHVPRMPRAAAPGSAEWMRWVEMQHAMEDRLRAEKLTPEHVANATFNAMQKQPKRKSRKAA